MLSTGITHNTKSKIMTNLAETQNEREELNTQPAIVAAFQVWGIDNTSGLYLASRGDDVMDFIDTHYDSGTFATLLTFESEEEAIEAYNEMQDADY